MNVFPIYVWKDFLSEGVLVDLRNTLQNYFKLLLCVNVSKLKNKKNVFIITVIHIIF